MLLLLEDQMNKLPLLEQMKQYQKAAQLIELGARMQILDDLFDLPREKMLSLYKEVKGEAPPRGLLPFSTDWFLEWQPSIHSAIYLKVREEYKKTGLNDVDLLISSYEKYSKIIKATNQEEVLSITRAWSLDRFIKSKLLKVSYCKECFGGFPNHPHENDKKYICGLCKMPSRAGKGGK